ncbi:MAG: helix-turn-helix domain-containing protein [Bifidobacteriaceae bacterium]|nr:helix-turn-helix domain-containing protein [Bifidobacteriaceae bacterium]
MSATVDLLMPLMPGRLWRVWEGEGERTLDVRNATDVARVLRSQRRTCGLTQDEVARRMGVSRQWVVAAEAGAPAAGVDLVLRALQEVGLRIDVYQDQSDALYAQVQEALR